MKHILQDNALESWAMSIKYSNFILNGKATLQYRKQFVSSLHNAVELFIKQLMLDNNDHRVCLCGCLESYIYHKCNRKPKYNL